MKNIQLRAFRRVPRNLAGVATLTLIAVAVAFALWWRTRTPRSGQGMSPPWTLVPQGEWTSFSTDYPSGYPTEGFDFYSPFEYLKVFHFPERKVSYSQGGKEFRFQYESANNVLEVFQSGGLIARFSISDFLNSRRVSRKGSSPVVLSQHLLTLDAPSGGVRFYLENISAVDTGTSWDVYHLQGAILVDSRK